MMDIALKKIGKSPTGVMDSNSVQPNDDEGNRKVRFDVVNQNSNQNQNQYENKNTFNPSHVTCTPSLESLRYIVPHERAPIVAPASSLVKPNYEDLLKRVAVVLHKHIITCENRYRESTQESLENGQFHSSMMEIFSEDHFISPIYVYHFTRASPISKIGFNFGMRKLQSTYEVPTLTVVHNFLYTLFSGAQLSAECSIVCLIYVERLMEIAHVPLMSTTWRPCVMCGLLLASKVWQDLSSWNSEIAQIYPQFTLQNINRLERTFCHHIKWDLYISSSLYAKYYFALRTLTEKSDFRRNYNTMVLEAPGAQQIAIRSENVKETMLHTTLSRSY